MKTVLNIKVLQQNGQYDQIQKHLLIKKCVDKFQLKGIQIFKRITTVIKFLAIRGLPLRGDHEIFGVNNNGNYLGLQKLQEKQEIYSKNGITVLFKENPFAVIVVTPIIKRAHQMKEAK